MGNEFNDDIVRVLQAMYKADGVARRLFDWVASRKNDASETTIDRFSAKLGINRGEAVALAKKIEAAGCGEFLVGRRGSKSRFVWAYSCISLGQAAAGESTDLEAVTDAVIDEEDFDVTDNEIESPQPSAPALTIAEAKRQLAHSLGIDQSS